MPNIPGHKGNANQNYFNIHLTPVRMAQTTRNVGADVRGKNPHTLWVGK
jgi:hypothetical protein